MLVVTINAIPAVEVALLPSATIGVRSAGSLMILSINVVVSCFSLDSSLVVILRDRLS